MRDPFVDIDAGGRRRGEPEVAINLTCTNLARRLQEAADAHHKYEATLAAPDPNWPIWYATFVDLSIRSILVADGKGGYRGLTQEELIADVKLHLNEADPFKVTVAREVRQQEELEAGQGIVEEGKARLEEVHEHHNQVVTPLTITCNDEEVRKDEERLGFTESPVVANILSSLRCWHPPHHSDDLGMMQDNLREEERDRVKTAFEEYEAGLVTRDLSNDPAALADAFKAGEDTMARLIAEGKVKLVGHEDVSSL